MSGEPYLSKEQVAEMLGVSKSCVDRWMKKRLVPYFKLGGTVRFIESDLRSHLADKHRVAPKSS